MANELFILVAEGPDQPWIKKEAGIGDWLRETREEFGRGTSNLKEFVNVPKHLSEMVFSPYGEQMGNLREVDKQIYFWTKSLWRLVSNAKSAFGKGRWMDSIYWLSQINKNLKGAVEAAKPIKELEDKQLEQFYGESEQPILGDYFAKPGDGPDDASTDDYLLAEAGILDALSPRAFTRRKLERMYRYRLQMQKRTLKKLLDKATATVDSVKGYVSDLASARASGDVSTYISLVKKIGVLQFDFEKQFRADYDAHFAEMAERLRSKPKEEVPELESKNPSAEQAPLSEETVVAPTEAVEAPAPSQEEWSIPLVTKKPQPKQLMPWLELDLPEQKETAPVVVTPAPSQEQPSTPSPVPQPSASVSPEGVIGPEGFQESDMPGVITPPSPQKPKRQRGQGGKFTRKETSSDVDDAMLKLAHVRFINEFAKLAANNDVGLMILALCKYSEQLEGVDDEKSVALLDLAQKWAEAQDTV